MFCLVVFALLVWWAASATQVSPTNKNLTPCYPLAWETREAQPVCAWWVGLAPGELPSWSQLLQCIVSMVQLVKFPAFIAASTRRYCGMFICRLKRVSSRPIRERAFTAQIRRSKELRRRKWNRLSRDLKEEVTFNSELSISMSWSV